MSSQTEGEARTYEMGYGNGRLPDQAALGVAIAEPASTPDYLPAVSRAVVDSISDAICTLSNAFYAPADRRRSWSGSTRAQRFVERTVDVVVATIILVAVAPLLLVLMIGAHWSSGGSAIFGQVRVGQSGSLFRCYKLRTMVADADQRLQVLLAENAELQAEFDAGYKLRHDPRITKFGRFLRRTSLDELPQLFNVVRGDMSLVGPRPIVPAETTRYGAALPTVLRVRPGMTGQWQVSGRNDLSYDERVRLDHEYASDHSILTNLRIMAKTLMVVLRPGSHGAY
jgi:lipopolysaccharide/colanic/teichoic acid biosynthesis glycosyltransferase